MTSLKRDKNGLTEEEFLAGYSSDKYTYFLRQMDEKNYVCYFLEGQ